MRRFALVLGLVGTTSGCTLWLALECPYDCDKVDAQGADVVANDAANDVAHDGGCSGPYATSLDGVHCLDTLDVGEPVAAVVAYGTSIFVLGSSGAVYRCSDVLCSSVPVISPTDAGPAHFGIAAAVDGGVFWAAGTASSAVILDGVSGKPAATAADPAYATALAASGSSLFWTQSQGGGKGIRTCTLGASCTTGNPAGTLVTDAGLATAMVITTANLLAWCDGTQVVYAGNQVATTMSRVMATGTGGIFWNNGTQVDGCDLPNCTVKFTFDSTTLGSSQPITQISVVTNAIAWLDQAPTVGVCPFAPQTSQLRQCSTTGRKTFDLTCVAPPAGVPNGLAFNGSVVVLLDGTQATARALRLVLQ
jgi:hypothetical protein